MNDVSADVAHLRELAAKCRRLASGLTDRNDIASFRQMAFEYEAMANRIEHKTMPNPLPPVS
jgi:hypothetical protein